MISDISSYFTDWAYEDYECSLLCCELLLWSLFLLVKHNHNWPIMLTFWYKKVKLSGMLLMTTNCNFNFSPRVCKNKMFCWSWLNLFWVVVGHRRYSCGWIFLYVNSFLLLFWYVCAGYVKVTGFTSHDRPCQIRCNFAYIYVLWLNLVYILKFIFAISCLIDLCFNL